VMVKKAFDKELKEGETNDASHNAG